MATEDTQDQATPVADVVGPTPTHEDEANAIDGIGAATAALRAAREAMEAEEGHTAVKRLRPPRPAKVAPKAETEEAPKEAVEAQPEDNKEDKESKEAKKEEEVVPERLAKSWASISKKEAQVRQQQQQIKAQAEAIESQRKELQAMLAQVESAKKDPFAYLDQTVGRDWYQKATERFLHDPVAGKPTTEETVARLQAQIAEEREAREKWFEERWKSKEAERQQQEAMAAQANRYMSDVEALVKADERFELTRITPDGIEAVRELVVGYLKEHNELLTPEQAATLVEQELETRAEALLKAQKLRAKYTQEPQKTHPPQAKPRSKTLTTTLAANGTAPGSMTPDQRIASAIEQLRYHRTQRGGEA